MRCPTRSWSGSSARPWRSAPCSPNDPVALVTAPLSDAELRVLKLLPTTGYAQIAATLFISHNTVKTHLRSIYQKLGGSSRSEAIERAVELRLL